MPFNKALEGKRVEKFRELENETAIKVNKSDFLFLWEDIIPLLRAPTP